MEKFLWVRLIAGIVCIAIGLGLFVWLSVKWARLHKPLAALTLSAVVILVGLALAINSTISFKFWKVDLNIAPESIEHYSFAMKDASSTDEIDDLIRKNPAGALGTARVVQYRILIRYLLQAMDDYPKPVEGDASITGLSYDLCSKGIIDPGLNEGLVKFAFYTHFVEWPHNYSTDATMLKAEMDAVPGYVSLLKKTETSLISGQLTKVPSDKCIFKWPPQ
jgi:hypothetical protein